MIKNIYECYIETSMDWPISVRPLIVKSNLFIKANFELPDFFIDKLKLN